MLRLLLYLVFAYLIWKIIQIVSRAMSAPPRDKEDVFTQRPEPKKPETFKDIKDADFEELPPDEKK